MARPIQGKTDKWDRLRRVAVEEPREASAAIAELAEALGIMADSLNNLRTNLDLVEAPKTANIKTRIQAARKYASRFRQLAGEEPEIVADALSEVYHSLDDVAGAIETLADNLGVELDLSPAEEAFGEEGKEEWAGDFPEEEYEEPKVDKSKFEEGEEELESPEAEEAEENLDEEIEKEAGSAEFSTDRDEAGDPKIPVISHRKNKRADAGSFTTDRDHNAKPETPIKTEAPEAKGESEVNKAAARRIATRQRISSRRNKKAAAGGLYGVYTVDGEEYVALDQPVPTDRVFPGWWGDAKEGESYISEWYAPAASASDLDRAEFDSEDLSNAPFKLYWNFPAVKGEEPEDNGEWPWDDSEYITVHREN